MFSSQNG
jgi:hypothetical protein